MMTGMARRLRAPVVATGLVAAATWALAVPVATGVPAPASGASGAAPGRDVCAQRPKICRALHAATKALIEAGRENRRVDTVCTSAPHGTRCGTTPPQPYLTAHSPYGNPADVEEGQRLLAWYLQDINCESLCRPKRDPQACMQACQAGKDPRSLPAASAPSP